MVLKSEKFKGKIFGAILMCCLTAHIAFAQTATPAPPPVPTKTPTAAPAVNISPANPAQAADANRPLTLAGAIDLSLRQASAFQSAQFTERLAAEDLRQAKAALYPKVVAAPNFIYTTPSLGRTVTAGVTDGNIEAISSRPPSFLGANAVTEYQAVVVTSGEIDTSGRLKAAVRRSRLLVESARLGGEIARRELIAGVQDAYFNLALATLKRRGAEENLRAAQDFENYEKLQLDAGEIAPVDLVRARLQRTTRDDELEQARAGEAVAADGLRVLVGYDYAAPIAAEDLLVQMPQDNEIESYVQTAIQTRPEFAQFEVDRKAAELDVKIAQKERRPQITYSVSSGFIADSLLPRPVYNSLGVQAQVGVTIPIFDRGASRSRETQARLKLQQTENTRLLAERQLAQIFFTARTQAISARTRIRLLAAGISDAEMNVSASQARYRAGEAPITEVTDANNTLVSLRQSLYQAIFDYQSARAKLLRAIGQ